MASTNPTINGKPRDSQNSGDLNTGLALATQKSASNITPKLDVIFTALLSGNKIVG
tara:strand:+ start:3358 stop:3525 length:168 start_codon:yes stop_codon:yes gene_type:complete